MATSSEVKNRYNKKTYQNHILAIRLDDPLNEKINQLKETGQFSETVKTLLNNHFAKAD